MHSAGHDERRLRDAADWLVRLSAADSPSASEIQAWTAWCGVHEENLRIFEELESLWRAAGEHAPSTAAIAKLLAPDPASEAQPLRERWRQRWHRSSIRNAVAAMAASTAAALILAALAMLMARSPVSRSLSTGLGEIRSVVLVDGSHVTLGGLSAVEVHFTRERRDLRLSAGEVLVEDEHHLAWPLIVSAGEVQARARGTSFDVQKGDDYVAICVMEGLVEVSVDHRDRRAPAGRDADGMAQTPPEVIDLRTGTELVVYANGTMEQHDIDPASAGAWRYGQIQFTDMSLRDVVQAIDRYTRRRIDVVDPMAGSLRFTGTVFLSSLDAWLQSLPQIFPVTVNAGSPVRIATARR